jgi:hypothetical protein
MEKNTPYPVKKLIRITEEQSGKISAYRFDRRLLSDNEAIRRLINIGLQTEEEGKSK